MELRHLQTFATAAELQSFTRAAKSLSLTQAAVSQHVAALEKDLGLSLFERTGRSMTLTKAGRSLYDYARKILDLVEEARSQVGQASRAVQGTLRLAASTTPAEALLPELLQLFRRQYPEVRESLTVTDSHAATEAVERGEADVGLVGEHPRGSRLSARAISSDELVLILSPQHPLANRKRITLNALRKQPLIVREAGSGSRQCVERALESAGLPPGELPIVMETNSNDAIRGAVERGIGAAFLSRSIVERHLTEGHLVSPTVQGVQAKRRLYVVTDPHRVPTPAVRAFLNFLNEWMQIPQGKHPV